jgi:putative ABC transport system substrate-binding protein
MLVQKGVGALCVDIDPFFITRPYQLVTLAARHALPAIYPLRIGKTGSVAHQAAGRGELTYRQAGIYAGKILNGTNPADLPVQQAVKVELVINLKIAKTPPTRARFLKKSRAKRVPLTHSKPTVASAALVAALKMR